MVKRILRRFVIPASAIVLVIPVAACNETNPSAVVTRLNVGYSAGSNVLSAGQTLQLQAVARYADGHEEEVTESADWESADAAVASVTATGLVRALGSGSVTVRAFFRGVGGSVSIRVSAPAS